MDTKVEHLSPIKDKQFEKKSSKESPIISSKSNPQQENPTDNLNKESCSFINNNAIKDVLNGKILDSSQTDDENSSVAAIEEALSSLNTVDGDIDAVDNKQDDIVSVQPISREILLAENLLSVNKETSSTDTDHTAENCEISLQSSSNANKNVKDILITAAVNIDKDCTIVKSNSEEENVIDHSPKENDELSIENTQTHTSKRKEHGEFSSNSLEEEQIDKTVSVKPHIDLTGVDTDATYNKVSPSCVDITLTAHDALATLNNLDSLQSNSEGGCSKENVNTSSSKIQPKNVEPLHSNIVGGNVVRPISAKQCIKPLQNNLTDGIVTSSNSEKQCIKPSHNDSADANITNQKSSVNHHNRKKSVNKSNSTNSTDARNVLPQVPESVQMLLSAILGIQSPDDLQVHCCAAQLKSITSEDHYRWLCVGMCGAGTSSRQRASVVAAVCREAAQHVVGGTKLRTLLFHTVQQLYDGYEAMAANDHERFVTCAVFLGEIFYYVRSETGAPFAVLTQPLLTMLIKILDKYLQDSSCHNRERNATASTAPVRSQHEHLDSDVMVVAKQLLQNGECLCALCSEGVASLVLRLTELLCRCSLSPTATLQVAAALAEVWPRLTPSLYPRTCHAQLAARMGLSLNL